MYDEHDEELALAVFSILILCSTVYVRGDYHLFPTSLPFLRDLFDRFMVGMEIVSPVLWLVYAVRLLRRWLIEHLRHSLRP
jgi:hypothetical protein